MVYVYIYIYYIILYYIIYIYIVLTHLDMYVCVYTNLWFIYKCTRNMYTSICIYRLIEEYDTLHHIADRREK